MSAPLDPQVLRREAASMPGALGIISYAVLKGLLAGGADAEVVAGVRILMQEHFEKLTDEDCNRLCDLVFERMQAEAARGGSWYPTPRP